MVTDSWNFGTKITVYGISGFHFYRWNEYKVIPLACTLVQETNPSFLRRPKRVVNVADNSDITKSQAANHHQLFSVMW